MGKEVDKQISAWTTMLAAMPIPAALVWESGKIVAVNRWLEGKPGDQLIRPTADRSSALRFGVSDTRWRVRPVNSDGSILLATGEREDVGDHLLRMFFSSGEALFVVYDQAGRVIESNAAWESLLGYSSEEIFGLDSWTLLPPDDLSTRQTVEAELRTTGRSDPTFYMATSTGEYRLVKWNLHFDFSVGRCFGVGRDITEEADQAAELERRAYTDELTGLANRARLDEHLNTLIETNRRPALLYCDLDRFKVVNDSLGHTVGDELLSNLAQRLRDAMGRYSDVMIARLGGDEFVVLIDNADTQRALGVADSLLEALREPIEAAGRRIHASMSVGIATSDHGATTSELLSRADTAVYEAKRRGRGVPVLFDDLLQARVERRFHVEAGLHDAISSGGIESFFQPIVDLSSGEIIGTEALVRWRKSSGELVVPGGFLDVAEDAGLLPAIGALVARSALDLGRQMSEHVPNFVVSINVSQDELLTDGFAQNLTESAQHFGLPPGRVIVEIVESAVISTDQSLPVLEKLRATGFAIALDDFGTGFSSLTHLRDLPIDIVKVDRSFVASMTRDPIASKLTKSLVDLGDALNLTIIMEGIETIEQEEAVVEIGGLLAQGYHYYKPMPASDLLGLFAEENSAAS